MTGGPRPGNRVVQLLSDAGRSPKPMHSIAEAGVKGAGSALPHGAAISKAFGAEAVAGVRAAVGPEAQAACEAMGARAYAFGDAMAFAEQAPSLGSVAHEMTHVMQQRKGLSLPGGVGREGDRHERQAHRVADAVKRGASIEGLVDTSGRRGGRARTVQRDIDTRPRYARNRIGTLPTAAKSTGWSKDYDNKVTKYSDATEAVLRRKTSKLWTAKKFYRYGLYEFERRYVKENRFKLSECNHGSQQYGRGLYVADTPRASIGYAGSKGGALIEVTVPRGTPITDVSDVRFTQDFMDGIRHPAIIKVGSQGWYVIRDDRLPLDFDFYKPSDHDLTKLKKKLYTHNTDIKSEGDIALDMIRHQRGERLYVPDDRALERRTKSFTTAAQKRLKAYAAAARGFEYLPFRLSQRRLDFQDDVNGVLAEIGTSTRFAKAFGSKLIKAVRNWSTGPFATGPDELGTDIIEPFEAAIAAYAKDRGDNMYQWRQRATGGKLALVTTLLNRFKGFRKFLRMVDGDRLPESLELHTGFGSF